MTVPVQAVLFDMDGTLLEPIDDGLPAFKDRWGIPREALVVPSLPRLPREAELEFMALEARVAAESRVRPGLRELFADLERAGVGFGIVTNNSAESVNTVLERHELAVSLVRTRADGPMKPAPDLVFAALAALGADPAASVFVGDTSADVGAARAARLRGCVLFAEAWNAHLESGPGDAFPVRREAGVPGVRQALAAFGAPVPAAREAGAA